MDRAEHDSVALRPRTGHAQAVFLFVLVPAAVGLALPVFAGPPSAPGDCNFDWWVDLSDIADLESCWSGPGVPVESWCVCHDQDGNSHVDLGDLALLQTAFTGTAFLDVILSGDSEDGTEVDDTVWHADGYGATGLNRMGRAGTERYDVGLRFYLPHIMRGDTFAYARLVLPGTGDGTVSSSVRLRIVGIDQDGVAPLDRERPSSLPKTESTCTWTLTANWPDLGEGGSQGTPLHRYSPNIAPIINEIVGRAGWGGSLYGKTLGIVIENCQSTDCNFLTTEDFNGASFGKSSDPVSPRLELYRTVRSTFLGRELLGQPTDHSVTLNVMSLLTLQAYVQYGVVSNLYSNSTPVESHTGGTPFEVVLDGLSADTEYFYRLRYRGPGEMAFELGPERRFHTQRPPGEAFFFTVQSDSHEWEVTRQGTDPGLCRRALKNIAADNPDFHIDLGDTFGCENYSGRDVLDFQEAVDRHLFLRPFLDLVSHSAPLFMAIGNHEGEQGWRLDGTPNNVAVWATNARKSVYPLPAPDAFYSGNTDSFPYVGLREDYYAWQWGDALFVVLDPYWYTITKPHDAGGTPGSGDNWHWTLGFKQYNWLRYTLSHSSATFKFVFAHQVTGGADCYGRGGIEAASHALGGHGSFEWGGENLSGEYQFDLKRPGWGLPVHEIMAQYGVTIFFHGHDHVFAQEELDNVTYQECPRPNDSMYGCGLFPYVYGNKVNNSGHLRVHVSPAEVTVDYVRTFLRGNGVNGEVAYSYTVAAP
jgi:hypothetical protein